MNREKLKKLETQVRIGGKGTPRRKKKVIHSTPATDDKKLQAALKKLPVNNIPDIEEVNIIKDDGTVIHFDHPKAQVSVPSNTFAVSGRGQDKTVTEMLPGILPQLGSRDIANLKKYANKFSTHKKPYWFPTRDAATPALVDDDVPDLVDNFEEIAIADEKPKPEAATTTTAKRKGRKKGASENQNYFDRVTSLLLP